MPRWAPDAAGRLHDAALELFLEQGFDATTVAEIAARAGLTERTFFNHFVNKREVLFGQTSELHKQAVVRDLSCSTTAIPPLDAVVHGLQAAANELLEGLRGPAARRRQVIDATPELQEREEAKRAALSAAITATLRERGVNAQEALLAAGTGVLIQQAAEQQWVQPDEDRPLTTLLFDALTALRDVVTAKQQPNLRPTGRHPIETPTVSPEAADVTIKTVAR